MKIESNEMFYQAHVFSKHGYTTKVDVKDSVIIEEPGAVTELLLRCKVRGKIEPIPYRRPYYPVEVIFNEPATIVLWSDGIKTVVKAQNGELFDPEKGLAMAITKRFFDNKGSYNNRIRELLDAATHQKTNSKTI